MPGLLTSMFERAQKKNFKEGRLNEEEEIVFRIQRRLQVYIQKKQTLITQNSILINQMIDFIKKNHPEKIEDNNTTLALLTLLTDLIKLNGYKLPLTPSETRINLIKNYSKDTVIRQLDNMLILDKKIVKELESEEKSEQEIEPGTLSHEVIINVIEAFKAEHPSIQTIEEYLKAGNILRTSHLDKESLQKLKKHLLDAEQAIKKSIELLEHLKRIIKEQSDFIFYEHSWLKKYKKGKDTNKVTTYAQEKVRSFQEEQREIRSLHEKEEIVNQIFSNSFFQEEEKAVENERKYSLNQGKRMLGVVKNHMIDIIPILTRLRGVNPKHYWKYPMPKLEALTLLRQKYGNHDAFKSLELNELSAETNQFVIVMGRNDGKDFNAQEMRLLFTRLGYNTKIFLEDHRGEHMSGAKNINGYYLKGMKTVEKITSSGPFAWASKMFFGYDEYYSDFFLKRMAPGEDRRHIKFWKFGNTWYGTVHDDVGFMPIPAKLRNGVLGKHKVGIFTPAETERTVAERLEKHAVKFEGDLDYLSQGQYGIGLYEFYVNEFSVPIKSNEKWRDEFYRRIYETHVKKNN